MNKTAILILLSTLVFAAVAQNSGTQQPAFSSGPTQSKTGASTRSLSSNQNSRSIPNCEQAGEQLQQFLGRLPRVCSKNADCDGYYLSANSCAPAVALRRPGLPHDREVELLRLQSRARTACAQQWSKQPACSAIPFRAACVQNRCVDTAQPQANEPKPGSTAVKRPR